MDMIKYMIVGILNTFGKNVHELFYKMNVIYIIDFLTNILQSNIYLLI